MFFYTFLPKLFNMSLTASVVIVFVLLLRFLIRKAPKGIAYALWSIVLFRLLCPVSIESGLSLFGLFDTPVVERGAVTSSITYVPTDIVHTEYPSVVMPVPGLSDAINDSFPRGEEQLVADPLEAPMSIATWVWIIGVVAMGCYATISYVQLRRKLITASPLRDNIYLADDITSPFVLGLFAPRIYLPSSLAERERAYIILHEQHHIRRLDHITKALAFVALCIHWFNPLVWLAFVMAGRDMEMSCDEAVIKKMGDGVLADYAASLLSLATGKRIIAGMPLAFGEGNTGGRIRNLANWKKPAFWVILVAVVACIALAITLLTNPGDGIPTVPEPFGHSSVDEVSFQDAINTTELVPGTTYVPYQCIFMNPLSSYAAIGGDSGYKYVIGDTYFAKESRRNYSIDADVVHVYGGTGSSNVEGGNEHVDSFPVEKWEWQEFPYTNEEWNALFQIEIFAVLNIRDIYEEILYQPLNKQMFLLRVDGDLWLVEKREHIWSIYSLVPESVMGTAAWEYQPLFSSRSPVFQFRFDMEYTEISAVCEGGSLVEFNYGDRKSGPSLMVPVGAPLCWSPRHEDNIDSSTKIYFTILTEKGLPYNGVLYIEAVKDAKTGGIAYKASLIGTGLHLSQNEEGEGGIISLVEER